MMRQRLTARWLQGLKAPRMSTPGCASCDFLRPFLLFAHVVLLFAMAACSSSEPKAADGLPMVRLGYFPNVTHAPALVGVARGDFEKGLEGKGHLKATTYNAGPSVIEAIFAGHLDLAYIGPSPTLNGYAMSKGAEVRVIAGAVENGVLVIGNKNKGITSLDQLKGARIATPQLGNTQDVSAKHYVTKELGSTLKSSGGETEVIPMANPDIELLFAKDQLDAAWVPEPWGTRLVEQGVGTLIAHESDLWPEKRFTLTLVIARAEFLEKHPELVVEFLKVHQRLTNELAADPQAHVTTISAQIEKLTGKKMSDTVIIGALKNVAFTTDIPTHSFEVFNQWAKDLGFAKPSGPALDGLVVPGLLEQARAGAGAP